MTRQTVWSTFAMDPRKEIEGVIVEYPGGIRVTIARAGGRNQAFAKAHEIHMRPHRQAAKVPGGLPDRLQREIVTKVYLDAVIKRFETNVGTDDEPQWKSVIVMEDGEERPVTRENLTELFHLLPDLLTQIITDSTDLQLYRKAELEAEAKNS